MDQSILFIKFKSILYSMQKTFNTLFWWSGENVQKGACQQLKTFSSKHFTPLLVTIFKGNISSEYLRDPWGKETGSEMPPDLQAKGLRRIHDRSVILSS